MEGLRIAAKQSDANVKYLPRKKIIRIQFLCNFYESLIVLHQKPKLKIYVSI